MENLVVRSDIEALAMLARTKLARMSRAWRRLLLAHEPGEEGWCRACPRRRRGRGERCAVWVMAHELLIRADLSAEHDARFAIDANAGHEMGATGVVGDDDGQLPDVVVQVWARREVGECCADIAAWLGRIGYRVSPGEVAVIASRHAQRLEAAWARRQGRGQGAGTGSALPP